MIMASYGIGNISECHISPNRNDVAYFPACWQFELPGHPLAIQLAQVYDDDDVINYLAMRINYGHAEKRAEVCRVEAAGRAVRWHECDEISF